MNKELLLKLALFVMILCLMIPLFAFGCSGSTTSTVKTSTPASTTAAGKPVTGGTFRVGASYDIQTLGYPAAFVKDVDYRHSAPCYECLGYYDKTGAVVPFLAEGWKEDPAAKTITITLKKGIKFQDDTDFNANAVKWNFQQFIDAKRSEVTGLTSMDVVDNYTLSLNFSAWNNAFISQFPFISPDDVAYRLPEKR